jgi:nucleoid DNA-binding protein
MSKGEIARKKDLIDHTAQNSHYHAYEVKDVLMCFYDVLRERLEAGEKIDLGRFYVFLEKPKPRVIVNNFDPQNPRSYVSPAYPKLRIEPKETYTRYLRGVFNGQTYLDRGKLNDRSEKE